MAIATAAPNKLRRHFGLAAGPTVILLLAGLVLAGCATHAPVPVRRSPHPINAPATRSETTPETLASPAVALKDLPGWGAEDPVAALQALLKTCDVASGSPMRAACEAARGLDTTDPSRVRRFFEARFEARAVVGGEGLMTGYFAPEYEARDTPDEEFCAPVRPRPKELTRGPDGRFLPWLERSEIERIPLDDGVSAFMRPEDLFFMQIQGSGFLTFPDGRSLRAAYAADNGRPFTGIARPMAEQGLLPRNGTSGEAIRSWLARHRGPDAQAITDLDARYVFFELQPDDGGEPRGASGVRLPAGRGAAIDPGVHAFGELLWVSATSPVLSGAVPEYHRLVAALDTGGAIRGPVRVDLYLGRGPAAGREAGRIRHPLRLWRLVPKG